MYRCIDKNNTNTNFRLEFEKFIEEYKCLQTNDDFQMATDFSDIYA